MTGATPSASHPPRWRRCAAPWRVAASPAPRSGPTPGSAASSWTPTARVVAEGFHRGAGHAARGGRRARRRWPPSAPAAADRGRHPRAVQPHRPHRSVRRGAPRGRRTPGRARAARRQPGVDRGSGAGCAPPASRSTAACCVDEARALNRGLDVRGRARPPLRHLEARHLPRRPQRRRRRHQPLGQQRAPRAATPTGCAAEATSCWPAPAPCWSTTRSSRCATTTTPRCPASGSRCARSWGCATCPPTGASSTTPPRPSTCAPATRTRRSADAVRPRPPPRVPRGRAAPGRGLPGGRPGRRGRRLRRPGAPRRRDPRRRGARRRHPRRRPSASTSSTSRCSGTAPTATCGSPCARRDPRRGGAEAMFTGIVEELGTVAALEDQGDAMRLTVRGPTVVERRRARRLDRGQRLLPHRRRARRATASPPTSCARRWPRPASARCAPGSRVNLERAVTPTTRLGGHVVQGHVDATGDGAARDAQRALGAGRGRPAGRPRPLPRGEGLDHRRRRQRSPSSSVDDAAGTLHGLADPRDARPHHARRRKAAGDPVNLEVDVIAKYVERLLAHAAPAGTSAQTPGGPPMELTGTKASGSTASRTPSPTSPRASRSSSSTTRTARTRATSSSPPARPRPS